MKAFIILYTLGLVNGLPKCSNVSIISKDFCENEDYLKHINPDYPNPTTVYLDIIIRNILDVNEEKHLIDLVAYANYDWKDTRLDIKSILDGQVAKYTDEEMNDVWYTGIVYSNAVTANKRFKYYTATKKNGIVWFKVTGLFKFKITCEMDFSSFPFDAHVCYWKIRSYYENIKTETLKIRHLHIEAQLDEATESKPISSQTKIIPFYFQINFGIEDIEYFSGENKSIIFVPIHFTRKSEGRYQMISSYFVPTGLFATLSLVSYLIKPEIVSSLVIFI